MDKRTIIAFVLIGIILFFYGDYVRWLSPPKPAADSTAIIADTSAFVHTPVVTHVTPGSIGVSAEMESSSEAIQQASDSLSPITEREITVETERYRMVISSQGAQIKSLRLKPYGRYLRDGAELIPDAPGERPGYRFWTVNGAIATAALAFRVEGMSDSGDVEIHVKKGETENLSFFAPLSEGKGVRLTYKFVGEQFNFFVNAEGVGMANVWVRDYVEALWTGGLAYTEVDTAQDYAYSMAYTYFAGDALENQKIDGKKSVVTNPSNGQVRWEAVRTKYFMVAMLPETAQGVGSWMESKHDSSYVGKYPHNRLGVALRLPLAGGSPTTAIRLFAGPLDVNILRDIDPSLTKTMNWGWAIIAPFSRAILWGLKNLYTIIPNYGICIIIFSILIKIIIWPLTHKSYTSMAAMQRVQPKLTAMREKYKGDPQRLNKEMMALYKEEKINPMGGCLPMLLQLPLLYALFIIFRSTIELRQAPFMLWIKDLSQPDYVWTMPFSLPIYGNHLALLPILMAISTYYQSKTTMTDPNQKAMIYMMPVMMLLFFNSFPSGLTLYYTLFNVLTLVQQKITPIPKADPAMAR